MLSCITLLSSFRHGSRLLEGGSSYTGPLPTAHELARMMMHMLALGNALMPLP